MIKLSHESRGQERLLNAHTVVSAKWVPLEASCIDWERSSAVSIDLKTVPAEACDYMTVASLRFVRQPMKILQGGLCIDAPVFDFEVIQGQPCAKHRQDCGVTLHSVPSKCRTFRSSELSFDSARHKLAFRVTCTTNLKRGHYSSEGMCFFKDGVPISSIFKVVARPGGHAIAKRRESASKLLRGKSSGAQETSAILSRSQLVADSGEKLNNADCNDYSTAKSECRTIPDCVSDGHTNTSSQGENDHKELKDKKELPGSNQCAAYNALGDYKHAPIHDDCADVKDTHETGESASRSPTKIRRRQSMKRRQNVVGEYGDSKVRHVEPASRPLSMPHARGLIGDCEMNLDLHQLTFASNSSDIRLRNQGDSESNRQDDLESVQESNITSRASLKTETNESRLTKPLWDKTSSNISATFTCLTSPSELRRRGSYPCLKSDAAINRFKVWSETTDSPRLPMGAIDEYAGVLQPRQQRSSFQSEVQTQQHPSDTQNQNRIFTALDNIQQTSAARRRCQSEEGQSGEGQSPCSSSKFIYSKSLSTTQPKPLLTATNSGISSSIFQRIDYERDSFQTQAMQIDSSVSPHNLAGIALARQEGSHAQMRQMDGSNNNNLAGIAPVSQEGTSSIFTSVAFREDIPGITFDRLVGNHGFGTPIQSHLTHSPFPQRETTAQAAYMNQHQDTNTCFDDRGVLVSNHGDGQDLWSTTNTINLATSTFDLRMGRSIASGEQYSQQQQQQQQLTPEKVIPTAVNFAGNPCRKMDLYSRFEDLLKDAPSP